MDFKNAVTDKVNIWTDFFQTSDFTLVASEVKIIFTVY